MSKFMNIAFVIFLALCIVVDACAVDSEIVTAAAHKAGVVFRVYYLYYALPMFFLKQMHKIQFFARAR